MALPKLSTASVTAAQWDGFVTHHPDGHTLQTSDWGRLKRAFGWSAEVVAVSDEAGQIKAGAQILYRPLPLKLGTMAYIPAGPLFYESEQADSDAAWSINHQLWQAVDHTARKRHAAFLKVEPCDWFRPRPELTTLLQKAGLHPGFQTIQPPRTVVLDIADSDDAILKRMNQSTRYKVKLGPKKEVTIREGSSADVASFTTLMATTAERDAFGVHDLTYYQMAFDLFASGERCALLLASYAGKDLAGVMVFRCGENAYYFYGASSNEERNRMPTYIAQWEAIRWAKRHGAIRYDLWGIPDVDESQLEAQFEQRHDGLWGVYGAKRGYGGIVKRSLGAWDKTYNSVLYAAYRWYIMRRERESGSSA